MTMFVAIELHEFVFFSADKRVTTRSRNGASTFSDNVFKLHVSEFGISTGCGLEDVVTDVAKSLASNSFTLAHRQKISEPHQDSHLNGTRVVYAPRYARENERLIWIKFGSQSNQAPFEVVGGLIDGAAEISDEHRAIIHEASSEFVKSRNQSGAFSTFLSHIAEAYKKVSNTTCEVSESFDFAIQYPDGKQLLNRVPS